MKTEQIPVQQLKPHPKNYKTHPPDQLLHIKQSLTDHGAYRPIVVAKDNTILAGHGVVEAMRLLHWKTANVCRMDLDPDDMLALKILVGDNEISNLAEVIDQKKTDVLKELNIDRNLLGTGYDAQSLAALIMLTRDPDELLKHDAETEWEEAGMPDCKPGRKGAQLMIQFKSTKARDEFVAEHKIEIAKHGERVWSAWWPPQVDPHADKQWVSS